MLNISIRNLSGMPKLTLRK